MSKFTVLLSRWSPAQLEADHFREGAFLATVGLAALSAWLWVGQKVASGQVQAGYGLLLVGIIGSAVWAVFYLYRSRYLYAVILFLAAQVIFITMMLSLLHDLAIGYLFLLTVVMGGAFLGPVGSFLAVAVTVITETMLVHSLPVGPVGGGTLITLIIVQFLAALVSAQAAQGLYAALEAAESSARKAQEHAEEARQHRGELHRTLKSLDLAYAQLQRVNADLLQAREIADAALRFKKEFAAQTSHELRTPLNLIIGFSETMAFSQNSYGVKLPAAYLRDVTEIHRNSRHLLTLIDDILDLSKLESGRMGLRFTLVDIREVLQEVMETVQPLTQAKGLELILEVPESLPTLWLDRDRIHQILLNLLSNAARLTKQGRILLQVRLRERQNELLIEVSDTGPGIPPEMLSQVFEEYQQVGETAGSSGTTGLGLAISKRIVELHGGRIWAESEVGIGTTFSFVLPVHEPIRVQPDRDRERPDRQHAAQPALVVLGEDGSDDVKLLKRHLEGYVLAAASSWKNARQLVESVNARAVITTQPTDASLETVNLPVPVFTCPLPSSRETAQTLGVASYIRKPLTIRALHSALRQKARGAKTLLIVADDPSTLRLIERMAQGSKTRYKIFRAYESAEALGRVRAQTPDAIVLDLNMSNDDGQALVAKLKSIPKVAGVPMIVISGGEGDGAVPDRPITISNSKGFTPSEILNYLQAVLSVVPPARLEPGTSAPPLRADRPA